ncbi:hypothetical protein NIES4071_40050 [Calothrix sp. NIES-4071]|nr:hypothetical protein NIES4071_40050 [Calothrix sp. NIES-4071]BAZ58323.1 hypothetical protein NIES4105_39990 [Calothrix sp. NIES-4105]
MASDIDVNQEELSKFIAELKTFQQIMADKLQAVERDWLSCEQSWKGEAKDKFASKFDTTLQALRNALDMGEEAQDWLEKFDKVIRDFEGYN